MKKKAFRGKMIAGAAAVALLMAAIFIGTAALERAQQSEREQALRAEGEKLRPSSWTEDNTVALGGERYGFDHRIETFLFIGADDNGGGSPENFRGGMADFLLLMVLDHTDDAIGCIQIDRNTITAVRELDMEGREIASRDLQICTAHWYGRSPEMAAENVAWAVGNCLGGLDHIDGYYVLSMDDIGALNHAVGGVAVTIEDDLNAGDPALARGETLVLNDGQAEAFLRARRGVGKGQNAERMARQRQYMASLFGTVRGKTMDNPKYGLELWDTLKNAAVTNMKGNDFSRIAQMLLKGEDRGIHTIRGETILGYALGDGVEHEEFYPDADSIRDEMTALFSLVPVRDGNEDIDRDEA